ncbi:hypothetical protein EJB05_48133, partial [Eragrostis curvula]
MLDSGFAEFKINYLQIKDFAIGSKQISEPISVGGYLWRIFCYPRGYSKELSKNGEYISIYLQLVSKHAKNVRAIFEAFLMYKDGTPSFSVTQRCANVYSPPPASVPYTMCGWDQFAKSSNLDPLHVRNGVVTITWGVIVARRVGDELIAVPPSDIGGDLGSLLDRGDGSDVSFVIGEETFPAHRAMLAARSPVFRAQLHGSMADATMPCITLHDINAATFKAMLRFIYTDDLPADHELNALDSPAEMLHDLLVVADRYALDRLKLLCASKIWDGVSIDNVGDTLCLAETHNCPELKSRCIDFLGQEGHFQKAALTDGFLELVQKFPSVLAELRQKFGA